MTIEAPIDGERSRRIAEIVGAALDLPPAERGAFLDEACGGDAGLRRQAEALLAAEEQPTEIETPPPRSLVGSTLSHYRILEPLGTGGMSEVYLAEDEKLGRRVALKVLPRELAGNPERLARFRREARTVAALNHPHIVTLHSTEDAQGLHFLTMELLEGGTLAEQIRPGGLPADELLRLALPLADAVAAAHARGITHRDLKPANVMMSADGRVKVVDFGLAKHTAEDRGGSTSLTVDGRILGTVAYMSPEQVVGHPVDCRSDVFSLGIVLYELATGEHPFTGPSRAELMSKILRDEPVPATARNPRLPRRLDEILDRCLEKDPDLRYPDAGALLEDLRALQREPAAAPAIVVRRRRLGLAVAAAAVVTLLIGITLVRTDRFKEPAPAAVPARTGVAVLHFQNLTGDPQLDWLRTGLTEMLVTDLSQSPRLELLATNHLYQILSELGALEERPTPEVVRQVARRAGASKVVLGSYAHWESNVLITFQIEDAATGRILGSDRVQGPGGERLLSLVDALAAAVHRHLDGAAPSTRPAALQDVTTSSPAALRLYTEALALSYQAKTSEAIVLLEKAVELDPDFALALADLGTFHRNLGHQELSVHYLRRAVEKAERLPVHVRSLVQGSYYARTWGTYGRAIESLRESLRLDPDRDAPRNNLALLESYLERYDDAVRDYEVLLGRGTGFVPTIVSAANAHTALGRFERAHRLLLEAADRNPDSWIVQSGLGWMLMQWGKLDEAAAALERAAALRPGEPSVEQARWRLAVLRQDWPAAESTARRMTALDDPYARWRGALSLARNAQLRGDFPAALEHLAAAAHASPQPDAFTALAHCWTADLLLDLGEPARALAEAQRARQIAPGDWPELQGMFLAALAEQELGHPGAADALLAELKRRAAANPNTVEERQILRLAGRLALARGDAESAVASLRKAALLLPPQGLEIHWHVQPDHVPVWYDLGRATLAVGRPGEARTWLEKAAASGAERIEFPVASRRAAEVLRRYAGARSAGV